MSCTHPSAIPFSQRSLFNPCLLKTMGLARIRFIAFTLSGFSVLCTLRHMMSKKAISRIRRNRKQRYSPLSRYQRGHCTRGNHEGSSCSDPRSRWPPPEGSIPMQSSTSRTRRCSSRSCSRGIHSSRHKLRVSGSGMEAMDPGLGGSRLSWLGTRAL